MGKVWFLSGLVLVVFLVFMVVNMAQVWATVTFNPNPPIDGQPFTIASSGGPGTSLSVYGSCGCNGGCGITAGASPYTVTLAAGQYNVFDSGDSSCTSFTVVPAELEVPELYSICVIQLGVQGQDGTIGWLPGYAYPGTPISQCQNKTDVLGQDVLDRTIMSHQYIMNGTSFKIVTIPTG